MEKTKLLEEKEHREKLLLRFSAKKLKLPPYQEFDEFTNQEEPHYPSTFLIISESFSSETTQVCKTEVAYRTYNPRYKEKLISDFFFERKQKLKITLYSVSSLRDPQKASKNTFSVTFFHSG